LDFVFERKDCSRLSCQMKVDASLDGLIIHVPKTQR
jgi:ferredoxin